MPPTLSVVFPMFDEEAYIERAVRAARRALAEISPDHEIVIVDDCSRDRTPQLADALARDDPRVKVVHNSVNRGLGGSLRAGYAVASKELILYTDADLPFDMQELPRAVRLLQDQQADVLAAYRFDRTSEGFRRTLYSVVYNLLVRALFSLSLKDVNFSFKLFRRALLEKFPLESEGSLIDAEFLLRARRAGANIIQIGVDYFPRSSSASRLSSPAVIAGILREMWALRKQLR